MNPITGYLARIDGVPCIEQFKLYIRSKDDPKSCSSAQGGTIRVEGNLDFTCICQGFGHTPPKMPGEKLQFAGYGLDHTTPTPLRVGWLSKRTGTERVDGESAIVDWVRIRCLPDENALIHWIMQFSANGKLEPLTTAGAIVPDALTTKPPSARGLAFTMRDNSIDYPQFGTEGWELEITSSNTEPIWPSDGEGWPVRDRGAIDATVEWSQLFDAAVDSSTLADVGLTDLWTTGEGLTESGLDPLLKLFREYKLYVTKAPDTLLYWDLNYMRLLEKPQTYVIRNAQGKAEFVRAKMKSGFSAYSNAATPLIGFIKKPAASPTAWWPVAPQV
jgi:hypothetical protein